MKNLLTIEQAATLLGCGVSTLRLWDRTGKLKALRTPGNQRRYRPEDLEAFCGVTSNVTEEVNKGVAVYARVSSHEQKAKGDLDRQKGRLVTHCVAKGYAVTHVLEEVGSGMSDTRPKMLSLFDLACRGKVERVVVEHKDRLTRFNFNLYCKFFQSYGVIVEWVEDVLPKSYEAELVEDMVSLMASFSARVYGKRSAENRKKKAQEKEENP